MNNKYQAIILAVVIVGALISYFTAESPFSIGSSKIHPKNCKCFSCRPNTPYKGNALELFNKKTEHPKPDYKESPSKYSSNRVSSIDDNPYRETPSNNYVQPSLQVMQEYYYDEPEPIEVDPVTWHECLVCKGTGRMPKYFIVGLILDDNGKICDECGEIM